MFKNEFLQLILVSCDISCLLKLSLNFAGVSVVHFEVASDSQCKQISPFVDVLCGRYPSINFLKVYHFSSTLEKCF